MAFAPGISSPQYGEIATFNYVFFLFISLLFTGRAGRLILTVMPQLTWLCMQKCLLMVTITTKLIKECAKIPKSLLV
jgi:hypothetical protein